MKRILFLLLCSLCQLVTAQTWDLVPYNIVDSYCEPSSYNEVFISEIYDCQNGNYGVIELFNPTENPIILSGVYSLKKYALPGTSSMERVINGTIQPYSTFIIIPTNTGSGDCLCDGAIIGDTFPNSWGFNAQDKIELIKNSNVIDQWVENHNTVGFTYIRKSDVTVPKDIYDANDWIFSDQANNTIGCYTIGLADIVPSINKIEQLSCTIPATIKITMEPNGPIPYTFHLTGINSGFSFTGSSNIITDLPPDIYNLDINGENGCRLTISFQIEQLPITSDIIEIP